jgi:hypothetical protein
LPYPYRKARKYLSFNRIQEIEERRQETGDRRQKTGDRRQETGDRREFYVLLHSDS